MKLYNPETGEYFHIYHDEPEDYRNADPRGIISTGRRRPRRDVFRPGPASRPIAPRPIAPRPIAPRPELIEPVAPVQPAPAPRDDAEYLTIRKSAFAELLPSFGKAWAAFLARPAAPAAVGDDIVDRDNATMHRDALAMHQQNQTRILSITDLVARAVKLFV